MAEKRKRKARATARVPVLSSSEWEEARQAESRIIQQRAEISRLRALGQGHHERVAKLQRELDRLRRERQRLLRASGKSFLQLLGVRREGGLVEFEERIEPLLEEIEEPAPPPLAPPPPPPPPLPPTDEPPVVEAPSIAPEVVRADLSAAEVEDALQKIDEELASIADRERALRREGAPDAGAPLRIAEFTLYARPAKKDRVTYFFSDELPHEGVAVPLPSGFKVRRDELTGHPRLVKA